MNMLAHKLETLLQPLLVLPRRPAAKPAANDNATNAELAAYLAAMRDHAGSAYVPASAKGWWLP